MSQHRHTLDPRAKSGIAVQLVRNARLIWRLLMDRRISPWIKAIIPATVAYLLSPIDIVPDGLLGLGQLDDLAILLLGVKLFLDVCPREIVREHWEDMVSIKTPHPLVRKKEEASSAEQPARYLEGKYRVIDDSDKRKS